MAVLRTDFNSFYLVEGVDGVEVLDLTVSTLGGCSGLERTGF